MTERVMWFLQREAVQKSFQAALRREKSQARKEVCAPWAGFFFFFRFSLGFLFVLSLPEELAALEEALSRARGSLS